MEFASFVKEYIRSGDYSMNWLENVKNEITPLFKSRLKYLLNGSTFIIVTDTKRTWFKEYFLANINSKDTRPFLPFVSIDFIGINPNDDIGSTNDLLSLMFPNGYIFFYIGDSFDTRLNLVKSKNDSFIWLFDDNLSNSLYLSSNDNEADIKLITLFKLFDACVDSVIFSRVNLW